MATGAFEAYGHRYAADASGVVIMDGWGLYDGCGTTPTPRAYRAPDGCMQAATGIGSTGRRARWPMTRGSTRAACASVWAPTGVMATGWVFADGGWYLTDATGALQYGWAFIDGTWYWLDPEQGGLLATGLFEVNGFRFCAPAGGAVAIDGWCFFRAAGIMPTIPARLNAAG